MNPAPPSLLVVAGEASADLHGAKVVAALRERLPGLQCFGLGGERLQREGLRLVADPGALNVVGLSEVVRALGRIRRVFKDVLREVDRQAPRAAMLLDLPDFNLRLARKLKRRGVPVVYYIAPQAWAWRKGRVRQLRRRVAKLCVLFPFEEEFFSRYGVPVEFVGHPLTEEAPPPVAASGDRVALVPGSRPREIERLLAPIAGAAALLKKEFPGLRFVLPAAPGVDRHMLESGLSRAGIEAEIVTGGASVALAGARLALVASGTATLEAALAGIPMVVVYRVSRLSYFLVRPFFRLPWVCIVNILAGRTLVPELLQGRVTPERVSAAARPLLGEGTERQEMIRGLEEVKRRLGSGRPSQRLSEILAGIIDPAPPAQTPRRQP